MKLYLTGIYYENCDKWECEGVFDTEEKALDNLPDDENAFILTTEMNKILPRHVKDADFVWFANRHTKQEAIDKLDEIRE